VKQHDDEMRRESKLDGAWIHALLQIWLNGKRLADTEANKNMMESLLQPHETATAAIYGTLATQYPDKFAWEVPPKTLTDTESAAPTSKRLVVRTV
jgi:hypothetical protein